MLSLREEPAGRRRSAYVGRPRIESDRLVLRAFESTDAEAIYRGVNDYDVVKNLARAPWPYRLGDAEDYVAHVQVLDPAVSQPFAVVHREHGLIGAAGFHGEANEPFPTFGYWIARPHWNQGYGSEAAAMALVWAGEDWGKRAVHASHFLENVASGRALIKAGMLYTGVVEPAPSLSRGHNVLARKMIWLA